MMAAAAARPKRRRCATLSARGLDLPISSTEAIGLAGRRPPVRPRVVRGDRPVTNVPFQRGPANNSAARKAISRIYEFLSTLSISQKTCLSRSGAHAPAELFSERLRNASGRRFGERVLVDLPIFHDDEEVLGSIRDEREILGRVAIDEYEVRQRIDLDDAEFSGVGRARS